MPLEFIGSPTPSLGVEIEIQVLDPETLDLTPQASLIIAKCKAIGLDRVKAEIHQSMLEINSEISQDVKQCREFLSNRIEKLNAVAKEAGLELSVLGTHPFQKWKERLISNENRYHNLHQKYQWLARRMNVYGLHVHVGMSSGAQALKVSNALIRYLPHLLALSANSPFWQGIDTGMQSCRVNIMESFPHAGIPRAFNHWIEFEQYCETLADFGVIRSMKDIYWFIRPNLEYGTLEIRICDASSNLDETMAIVALIQSLVVYVQNTIENHSWIWSQEEQWIAPENQWIAARDGLEGILIIDALGTKQKISEAIYQLIEQLTPTATELNCVEELHDLNHILARGNGAQRQRHILRETQSFREIIHTSVQEFRMQSYNGVFQESALLQL